MDSNYSGPPPVLQQQTLKVLQKSKKPLTIKEIAEKIDRPYQNTYQVLGKLLKQKKIKRDADGYHRGVVYSIA